MREDQLLSQLKALKRIKPNRDWVSLTKREIMGEEPKLSFFSLPRFALVGVMTVFVLFGFFGYSFVKNSLPGDVLYSVRKAVHEGKAYFVSNEEKPVFQLKLANERLKDLANAPVRNLAPTINEFQANMLEAAKNLENVKFSTSSPETMKEIVRETKKLEENKQKVESLGVVIDESGTSELENALRKIVSDSITDLADRASTEEEMDILESMEKLFEEGKYSEALEIYLTSQNQ
ncbi:MAG: hypothetical protein PHW72_03155 [Candidatus Pacebacteria bacterium]|nr:hypothetical protein [Candidatus Paceibacterota bacterium]